LTGPHDVSAVYDDEPRGFHLREYTYGDLAVLFMEAGFRRVRVLERPPRLLLARLAGLVARISSEGSRAVEGLADHAVALPLGPYLLIERLATSWPGDVSKSRLFRRLLGINIIAER
jgi:hypothetical protein